VPVVIPAPRGHENDPFHPLSFAPVIDPYLLTATPIERRMLSASVHPFIYHARCD
jgi:hypothetical protein